MKCDGCHKVIDATANQGRGWICGLCGARICPECATIGTKNKPFGLCSWTGWCWRMQREGNFQGKHKRKP